jgi:hypothetical protein
MLLAEMTGSSLIIPRLIKRRGPEPRRSQARLLARTGSLAQGPDLGSYKEFELKKRTPALVTNDDY